MFVFVTLFDYLSALQHYLLILTSNLGERGKFPVFTSITRLLSLLLSQERQLCSQTVLGNHVLQSHPHIPGRPKESEVKGTIGCETSTQSTSKSRAKLPTYPPPPPYTHYLRMKSLTRSTQRARDSHQPQLLNIHYSSPQVRTAKPSNLIIMMLRPFQIKNKTQRN